ncbi:DUF2605 family protein [Synechococcus sp. CS-1329]|uniref:DUF2605 family protein n=1 Tax=Synechococcus sp. CS-1329 TaxID=2847975 RepID=UPI00223A7CC5|nr:DUF2605 family protein [Synechococcus sp. CS-1329]MCT0218342.1 DUF2605 family protein [Synechococcus sp. CS-1329]
MSNLPPTPDSTPRPEAAGELLDQLLGSLLLDFDFWFDRGLLLLQHCPESVMSSGDQEALADRLNTARKELVAARSLRSAAPVSMALDMQAMAPWHRLVLSVWNLSAELRQAGVGLPELPPPPQP